jgi:hypothetical protein
MVLILLPDVLPQCRFVDHKSHWDWPGIEISLEGGVTELHKKIRIYVISLEWSRQLKERAV